MIKLLPNEEGWTKVNGLPKDSWWSRFGYRLSGLDAHITIENSVYWQSKWISWFRDGRHGRWLRIWKTLNLHEAEVQLLKPLISHSSLLEDCIDSFLTPWMTWGIPDSCTHNWCWCWRVSQMADVPLGIERRWWRRLLHAKMSDIIFHEW